MHKFTHMEIAYLRDHVGEETIGSDVEGYAEEHVGAALVELTTQCAIVHIKLKQGVARRQRHFIRLFWIPAGDDEAAAIRIVFDLIDDGADLIDAVSLERTVCIFCGAEVAPLVTVHRTQIPFFTAEARGLLDRRLFIPNSDVVFL